MKNFWKILCFILIGGIACETIVGYFIINNYKSELASTRLLADERSRTINEWTDYNKSIEEQLIRAGDEIDKLRGTVTEIEDVESRLKLLNRESMDIQSINYERYEQLQAILRELGSRTTEGEKAE